MNSNNKTKDRQSGFTLLELLLVVGVGALLLIGGIATYRLVTEGNKVSDGTRLLLQIKQEAQNLYQNQSSYDGISTAVMIGLGAIPDSGKHPFNGDITVEPSGTNDSNFTVTFEDVPENPCIKLGTAITDPSDVIDLNVAASGVDSPTLVSDLVDGCEGGESMEWTFN